MPDEIATLDWNDTFLDIEHLQSSFPGYEFEITEEDPDKVVRPFRLTFQNILNKQNNEPERNLIIVEPHVPPSRGPYIENEPKK